MTNKLSDKELNVGKILVLKMGHKLKVLEIKKLIKASKVKRVKWTGVEDIDSFVWHNVLQGLVSCKDRSVPDLDIFYVEGDNSTTSFLRLKIDDVIASLEWDFVMIKELHNTCLTLESMYLTQHFMEAVIDSHKKSSSMLNQQNLPNSLEKRTKYLDKFIQGYAKSEIDMALDKVRNAMKDRW
jgi:hypothetical protein